ncbi:MAG: pirin family protein [Prolixibacteraceae bacterium]|jgi:redox-sensitive bicupin YhaK (pirin superfamily)|nr:pirin family protein [Prolixibacteraceae bacterium]
METKLYRSEQRGQANHGWLNAHYSFSFSNYYNPENIHFGALRVLNDDVIQPGMGFGTHPHDNMEIITIPLKGALKHQDSMGHQSVITTGEVQVMSAGTGIRHSEFNASEEEALNLFQIWIFPYRDGLKPRYDQKKFETEPGKLSLLVSPDGRDGSLSINQNAFISRIHLEERNRFDYQPYLKGNGLFMMVIDGTAAISGETLGRRDAITLKKPDKIALEALGQLDLLILEVPV